MGRETQPNAPHPTSWSPAGCQRDSASSGGSSAAGGHGYDASLSPSAQSRSSPQQPPPPRVLRRKKGMDLMNSDQIRNQRLNKGAVGGSSEYKHWPLPCLSASPPAAAGGDAEKSWSSTAEEQEVLRELADQFAAGTKRRNIKHKETKQSTAGSSRSRPPQGAQPAHVRRPRVSRVPALALLDPGKGDVYGHGNIRELENGGTAV
ncbi:hypothetical protein LX36DRAFT_668310 [Colletotrichum falcatum]|nr:hypothetical protein LX36DRAFT_668310 [Colletotrichum falcatum]